MAAHFRDRVEAGRQLGAALRRYADRDDVIVLALPRGGVPVAARVAEVLNAPLDLFLVRKLGVPGHEELAMGAIASGGARVLNEDLVADLNISESTIEAVASSELRELARRERLYRGTRPQPEIAGRTVIVVDDGLATGSTMRAAIAALRERHPGRIVVAVPVAAPSVCAAFSDIADEVLCTMTPEPFYAVGLWYEDFAPTSDQEVQTLLREAEERRPALRAAGSSNAPKDGDPSRAPSIPEAVHAALVPMSDRERGLDQVLELTGDARYVLIGEASHGTHEFYSWRADVTKRLIAERGFRAVAAEADWPDAARVNRFVLGESDDADAEAALDDFRRFPNWMWRNTVVREFVTWLRQHNDALSSDPSKAGFYGLDLYSLNASIMAVIAYLDQVDPEAARRARARYGCFDHFGDDAQAYGYATSLGVAEPCEEEVVNQLLELQRRATELARRDGRVAEDQYFFAEQNARLAKNAEAYYRSMFRGRVSSWNLRDRHMAETLDHLVAHLDRQQPGTKVVVWAHNSHLGDARATQMGEGGELNLGQLVRERVGAEAVLIGFSTDHGTVTAASDWGQPAEQKRVRPGWEGSYEALFHEVAEAGAADFLLPLSQDRALAEQLQGPCLQRAIGVIYRPETERFSHYFNARLPEQFDVLIHLDETRALEPLEREAEWEAGEAPETYPFAV
ncbi:MAG TPA: erythromycin esterase family protein [Thermomicrobiales bacterium]|nr:erythromycin esterase family protein [Thermomicrobiales bacterium]